MAGIGRDCEVEKKSRWNDLENGARILMEASSSLNARLHTLERRLIGDHPETPVGAEARPEPATLEDRLRTAFTASDAALKESLEIVERLLH